MNYELFNGKNVKEFKEVTPGGNVISGKILLNHGEYHGSILIENLNGNPTKQFIRGFPKIHYFDENEHQLDGTIYGFEKLDGTCVGLYTLCDNEGKVIEHVPKSRQKAVLDPHFVEMLDNCDLRILKKHMKYHDVNCTYLELFGMLNEHTVPHKKTYIDVRLIGATTPDGQLLLPQQLEKLSFDLLVPLPRKIIKVERMNDNSYYMTFLDYKYVLDGSMLPHIFMQTEEGTISVIRKMLDKCNRIHLEEKGYVEFEGVVLQTTKKDDNSESMKYIKIKPESFFEAENKEKLTVPLNEIRKEIQKIISENITEYSESYDEREVISFINENLLEEYDKSDVFHRKTQNAITKELHKYINSINDKNLNAIINDLLNRPLPQEEYNLPNLMRIFADENPMLKHRSGDVYRILSKRIKKG